MQDLHKTKEMLQEIFDTIPLLRNEFYPLPILDLHNAVPIEASYHTIMGLGAFRESVRHDICAIDKVDARPLAHGQSQTVAHQ